MKKRKQLLRIFNLIRERLLKDDEFIDKTIFSRIDSVDNIYIAHPNSFIWVNNKYDEMHALYHSYLTSKIKCLSNRYLSLTLQQIAIDPENKHLYIQDLKTSFIKLEHLSEENQAIYKSLINDVQD